MQPSDHNPQDAPTVDELRTKLRPHTMQVGMIALHAAPETVNAEEFAICDGRAIKRDEYPKLFRILGERYGGDGQSTFNLPILPAPVTGIHYIIRLK